jgi:hypothetical protein
VSGPLADGGFVMTFTTKFALLGLLALGLLLAGTDVRADEEGIPSFKTSKDRDTKEFVGKVFESVVKAARLKTKNHKVEKYEYVNVKDKENKKELHITGTYDGAVISRNVKTTVTVKLDTSKKDAWEVDNIDYKDAIKPARNPDNTKIQTLIKSLNR